MTVVPSFHDKRVLVLPLPDRLFRFGKLGNPTIQVLSAVALELNPPTDARIAECAS